ncbi:hypothetical protein [Labrenzia sp. CE80]|uniref:hypothetical protein n=1 Tax=Labrenzia sp. CE80 TaxID=1788986 RepID=UPI00129B7898|nr:hypothetical protein [Labrenzia sp. CE80]
MSLFEALETAQDPAVTSASSGDLTTAAQMTSTHDAGAVDPAASQAEELPTAGGVGLLDEAEREKTRAYLSSLIAARQKGKSATQMSAAELQRLHETHGQSALLEIEAESGLEN